MAGILPNQQVNQRTLAEMLDLTPQRINQLVIENIIPKTEHGRYELVACVKAYIQFIRKRPSSNNVNADDYNAQRTRLTKAKADMAEMEKEQMANNLIPVTDVTDAWETMAMNMRTKLLAIPTRTATSVFAADNVIDAKRILKENINEALKELSSVEIRTNNPIRAADVGDDSDADAKTIGTTARVKNK